MTREEIIKQLIEEMSECGLFVGKYDAENGSEQFMYGVDTVMEYLAYKVSEEYGDKFCGMFLENMVESKKRVIDKKRKV